MLARARVARLATADRNGLPHLVPVCFVVLDERLYSIIDATPTRRATSMTRLRNIAENPAVAVLVDEWSEDWARLAWVMIRGQAAVNDDPGDYAGAVAALRAKYVQYRDMTLVPDLNPLIAVCVQDVIAWQASPT